MVSFVPIFRSQIIISIASLLSRCDFTSFEASRKRITEQSPSTEDPSPTCCKSSSIVRRAQFSFNIAWFGQHSGLAGRRGGATRRDGSNARQSPRTAQGGERHASFTVGTHTSCCLHTPDKFEDFVAAATLKQFGKPHQRFVQRDVPFSQIQALQYSSVLPARASSSQSPWVWFKAW